MTRRSLRLLFALLLAAAVPLSSHAQQTCERRTVPVSFLDGQILPIRNVAPRDLVAQLDKKPVKILSIVPDERPHRIVLVLDSSGSMDMGNVQSAAPSYWTMALTLAQNFAAENADNVKLALVMFNSHVTDTIGFDAGNAAVEARLHQLLGDKTFEKTSVRGRTPMRDAVALANQLFDHPTSADAIYLLTDGDDNASVHKPRDVTRLLSASSVRLFVTLFPQLDLVTEDGSTKLQELSDMATYSGGEILLQLDWYDGRAVVASHLDAIKQLTFEQIMTRLYQTILQDDLVEIELPAPAFRDEKWKLNFSEDARQRWKDAKITYPVLLSGCPLPTPGASQISGR